MRYLAVITLTLLVLAGCQTTTQGFKPDLKAGEKAYLKSDYATALKHVRPLAEQGLDGAQLLLGGLYARGRGVTKDVAESVRWIRKAAEQGHTFGQFLLGVLYGGGRGVIKKDEAEGVRWARRAGDKGLAIAQVALGISYYEGTGVTQDHIMSFVWGTIAKANSEKPIDELYKALLPLPSGYIKEKIATLTDEFSSRFNQSDRKRIRVLIKLCFEKPASCPEYSDD